MVKIVLCYPTQSEDLAKIAAAMPDAEIVNAGQERIREHLSAANIFCGHAKVPVDWDRAVAAGNLKWIQSSAAGLDHCLVPDVIASDIVVTSASGLFADQVAEQTMALILAWYRSLPRFFRAQQDRDFTRQPTRDLTGKTVGIVGFGGNGRRIAEVLAPWRVKMVATDMFPIDRPAHVSQLWPADQLDRLLATSDIVILCVPLNDQTRCMIRASNLAKMKRGSLLINVARGPVVDESAMIAAIASKQIAGAGLDVTEIEPLAEASPLWTMNDVIITPHVGAQSARRVSDTTDLFCDNLQRYQAGRPLQNLVDKRLGFPIRRENE